MSKSKLIPINIVMAFLNEVERQVFEWNYVDIDGYPSNEEGKVTIYTSNSIITEGTYLPAFNSWVVEDEFLEEDLNTNKVKVIRWRKDK